MPIIKPPWRWTFKPPPGSRIDPTHPLATGLIGFWLLNEGSGPRLVDLTGHADATASGTAWQPGPIGPELAFDGTTSSVAVPTYAALDAATKLSIVAHVRDDNSGGGFAEIARKGAGGWFLLRNATGSGYWEFSVNGTNFGDSYTPSISGERAFLIGTHDGSRTKLYKNGIKYQDIAETGLLANAGVGLDIGSLSGSSQFFQGRIASVRLYDRALSADEAARLTAEPFSMIEAPSTRRLFLPAGSGGGTPQTISPAGIGSGESVGTPTLTAGPVAISPAGIASAESVGTPTLTPGPVTLSPTGIASAESVGSPTITAAGTIAPLTVSGLVAGWFPERITGATDGGPLGSFADASGNGHDGSATGTQRPTYNATGMNALPAVTVTADGQWFSLASPITLPDTYTLYVVASRAAASNLIALASDTTSGFLGGFGDSIFVVDDGNVGGAIPYTGDVGDALWRFRRAGAGQPHRFAAGGQADAAVTTTAGAITLDALLGRPANSQWTAAGDQFAGAVLYDRDLVGTADDATVQGYFASNRGVATIPEPTPTIGPTGIASAESVGTPAITPGAVSITPTGIAGGESVGSPTITATAPGATTINPGGIPSAEAVGTPAITPGPVTIAPQGIASTEAVGAPTITATAPGAVTIHPVGIASGEAVGTPTLTPGPITISPPGIASAESVGHPTLSGGSAVVLADNLLAAIQAAFDAGSYGDTIAGGLATVEQITRVPMPFATAREKSTRTELFTSTSQINAIELCVKVYAEDLDTAQELGEQLAGLFDGQTFAFAGGWTTKLTSQGDPRHDRERGWAIGGVPAWYQERTYHCRVRRART